MQKDNHIELPFPNTKLLVPMVRRGNLYRSAFPRWERGNETKYQITISTF